MNIATAFTQCAKQIFVLSIVAVTALGLTGCGSGDADEPVVAPSASSGQFGGPRGGSSAALPASTASPGAVVPVNPPAATRNTCDVNALNNGRFLGTGITVVAIVDDGLCPVCPSGEFCTTATGSCRCLVLKR